MKSQTESNRYNHLVLLCENQEGYRNLIQLVSTGYLEGFYYKPRIDKDLLARALEGPDRAFGVPARRYQRNAACGPLRRRPADRVRIPRPVRQEQFLPGTAGPRAGAGQRRDAAGQSAVDRNRHPAGRHQRLALPAQGTTRARTKSCCASRPARRCPTRTACASTTGRSI